MSSTPTNSFDRALALQSLAYLKQRVGRILRETELPIFEVASLRREAQNLAERADDVVGLSAVFVNQLRGLKVEVSDEGIRALDRSGWRKFIARLPLVGGVQRLRRAELEDEVRHAVGRLSHQIDHILFALEQV